MKSLSEDELGKVVSKGMGYYRFAYNVLKHAGKRKLKPSEDLTLDADLKEEAYLLIDAVIIDFNHLPLNQTDINNLSPALLTLLQSNWYFPSLDVHGPITFLNHE